MATLAAMDYRRLGLPGIHLTTFGSPRVGNSDFSKYFDSLGIPTFRLVDNGDIVPHFPPNLVRLLSSPSLHLNRRTYSRLTYSSSSFRSPLTKLI